MARAKSAGDALESIVVGVDDLVEYVGQPPFATDRIYDVTPPGVATAWRGRPWVEARFYECTAIDSGEGKGALKTTGQLGDVMKESSAIAHTFTRSSKPRIPVTSTSPTRLCTARARGRDAKRRTLGGHHHHDESASARYGQACQTELGHDGRVDAHGTRLTDRRRQGENYRRSTKRREDLSVFPSGNKKDYDELSEDIRKV